MLKPTLLAGSSKVYSRNWWTGPQPLWRVLLISRSSRMLSLFSMLPSTISTLNYGTLIHLLHVFSRIYRGLCFTTPHSKSMRSSGALAIDQLRPSNNSFIHITELSMSFVYLPAAGQIWFKVKWKRCTPVLLRRAVMLESARRSFACYSMLMSYNPTSKTHAIILLVI